jgi:hypothetical protein
MIVVEHTHWPVVVVGSVPDAGESTGGSTLDDEGWASADQLWMVLIVGGLGTRARASQDALVDWLCRHRSVLKRRAVRFVWVIEDDTLRACADAWQSLVGNTLFGVDVATFPAVRPALRWLMTPQAWTSPAPVSGLVTG